MNEKQTALIEAYFKKYPKDSLRKVSERTSIQKTRVYRIFNGHEMKVSEFQTIENLIIDNKMESTFLTLTKKCIQQLQSSQIKEIQDLMKKQIKLAKYSYLQDYQIHINQVG